MWMPGASIFSASPPTKSTVRRESEPCSCDPECGSSRLPPAGRRNADFVPAPCQRPSSPASGKHATWPTGKGVWTGSACTTTRSVSKLACAKLGQDLLVFGHREQRIAGNLNVGFPGFEASNIVHTVASEIAVSTGSACASASAAPSRVLLALGLDPEIAATGIRISLGRFTTDQTCRCCDCGLLRSRLYREQKLMSS